MRSCCWTRAAAGVRPERQSARYLTAAGVCTVLADRGARGGVALERVVDALSRIKKVSEYSN